MNAKVQAANEVLDRVEAFLASLPTAITSPTELSPADQQKWGALVSEGDAAYQELYPAIGEIDNPKDELAYQSALLRYQQLFLFSQDTMAAARKTALIILDILDLIDKKFEGSAIAKLKDKFAFLRERCKLVLDYPLPNEAKPPDWSGVVQGYFWQMPKTGLPTWVWIVAGVVGVAAVAALAWPKKPDQAVTP